MARRNSASSGGRRGASRTEAGRRKSPGDSKKPGNKKAFSKRPAGTSSPYKKKPDATGPEKSSFRKKQDDFENRGKRNSSEKPYQSEGRESKDRKKSASYGLPYKRSYDKSALKKGSRSADDRSQESPRFNEKREARRPGKFTSKQVKSTEGQGNPDIIRLNRYIANSGLCSRREADEFITMGLITVNGQVITELGHKVNRSDEVRYEGKLLKAEKPVYILMNKPKGYITTTKDPQERNTVMHLLGNAVKERVYPVGRLDRNTTGLLLLTNDGELADRLMHPSYQVKKIYKVELDRPLTKADFDKIKDGVYLEEGRVVVDDIAILDDNRTVGIEIHIGWNRVVRRIFEALGYKVEKLDRSVYAGLDKKDLGRGEWRLLKQEEIVRLKHYKMV